jgi:hypothetical protein
MVEIRVRRDDHVDLADPKRAQDRQDLGVIACIDQRDMSLRGTHERRITLANVNEEKLDASLAFLAPCSASAEHQPQRQPGYAPNDPSHARNMSFS